MSGLILYLAYGWMKPFLQKQRSRLADMREVSLSIAI